MTRILLYSLLLLSVSWNFSLYGAESFNNRVLCLLDQTDHTYLFRGKIPLQNGKFCYEELKAEILRYAEGYDLTLSPDFKLISVSLLNRFADRGECAVEEKWFSSHPDKGWLWRYALFGYGCSPHYIPKGLRKAFYFIDVDGLRYFVRHLKHLVDCNYSEDVVVYMHCNAGKDRTGEASACYLMQYKGYSHQDAIAFNQKLAKRKLRKMSMNAIRWHAYYLRDVCRLDTIGQID